MLRIICIALWPAISVAIASSITVASNLVVL
jgi:hypothetical protein